MSEITGPPTPRLTALEVKALVQAGSPLVRAVGPWVLFGRPVEESGGAWSFRTYSIESAVTSTEGGAVLIVHADGIVLPLVKRAGTTAFTSVVLLGRASSNDVVVPHASVSKLHARLEPTAAGVYVEDMGSSNGTRVTGETVPPNEKRLAASGTTVGFGACGFTLLSASDLERAVRELR